MTSAYDNHPDLSNLALGEKTEYRQHYAPELLQPVPRRLNREQIGVTNDLPFHGSDIWTGYELSWLNEKGLPQVAIATFAIPCTSTNLVESKSFKLYLNSFNQHTFSDWATVQMILKQDLSKCAEAEVDVSLATLDSFEKQQITGFDAELIDNQDIDITDYDYQPALLKAGSDKKMVSEKLQSHLLKSNCLITNQPDWGSVMISYTGQQINHASLLRYIVSFRNHNEFHEQCVERIFTDLQSRFALDKLTVYARYTRRGGLDINPFRSNFEPLPTNIRMARQ
ncbi:NADPH-dependent 7-cyano-7-deazaguanine reductase QueF [Corallincola luteus]|uniref:NADPH-dependent 7-cyano-7-deazaguanine reductase n=1 Tax=Corallincola luteus TaxID=1775177 RepID=A0ABY2AM30_9GAMM|nr:NADPH-dependent 7-cyano-7-deazaguanine reductase QueF [Corallincola luteus]TCI02995.1 NADPH-dependent 7-cyano-7-deazaguanine reductase QueF [Corallincola luteus]